MSGFCSELLPPGDSESLCWLCCQHCPRLEDCPYVYDQVVRRAACQGHEAARLLNTEADRLQETVSRADDSSRLLDSDKALEDALSRVLHWEMALIDRLCTQTGKRCP